MTSIAELLDLPDAAAIGSLGLAGYVAEGLPVRSADKLRPIMREIGPKAFYELIPEATLRRARTQNKPLSRDASERLYDMARVLTAVEDLFGDRAKALRFMERPNPFLSGQSPFDLSRSSTAGAQAVLDFVGQIKAGVAA